MIGGRFGILPAALVLLQLAHAAPAVPARPLDAHWLWSPYQGRLGPVHLSEGGDLRAALATLEPIW